ncbi:MAG TPA: MJ0042-type zinc finger domain-containing protein [Gemmataceae bacterium]|nr:MJ0042-type zinc finger domain-containing protein [Gemmataceae bacterium]
MPEQIRCPSCDAALRVPETLLGKNVKCPKCQKTFLAEIEEPAEPEGITREPAPSGTRRRPKLPENAEDEEEELPPEEEFEEEEERPRRRKRRRRRYAEAEAAVAGPAISLIVLGSLDLVLIALGVLLRLLGIGFLAAGGGGQRMGAEQANAMASLAGGVIGSIVALGFAVLILVGGLRMRKLENYGLAMTACIFALLPCGNCCLIGLPLGIWGLVVLNRPEVKDAFS